MESVFNFSWLWKQSYSYRKVIIIMMKSHDSSFEEVKILDGQLYCTVPAMATTDVISLCLVSWKELNLWHLSCTVPCSKADLSWLLCVLAQEKVGQMLALSNWTPAMRIFTILLFSVSRNCWTTSTVISHECHGISNHRQLNCLSYQWVNAGKM